MNNNEYFNGKVVIITGSSKGIGKALAMKLGQFGARVVLNGRSLSALQTTESELKRTGCDCFAVQADVSLIPEAKKLIDKSVEHYGKIDVLVNNAGIAVRGLFAETDPLTWENVIHSNTLSYIYCTHFALPQLKKTQSSIVFISSIGGRAGLPGHGAYSVSKMPLTSLAQTLDIELQQDQIHVGIVYVGFTRNDSEKVIIDGKGLTRKLMARKNQQLMEPDKVAAEICNLIRKRKRLKVLSLVGHLQSFFYIFPAIRRLVMRNILKKYDQMYPE